MRAKWYRHCKNCYRLRLTSVTLRVCKYGSKWDASVQTHSDTYPQYGPGGYRDRGFTYHSGVKHKTMKAAIADAEKHAVEIIKNDLQIMKVVIDVSRKWEHDGLKGKDHYD